MDLNLKRRRCAAGHIAASVFILISWPALAVDQVHDEIQVYKGDIAEVGQWSYYSDFGKIGNFLPLPQQSRQLYAVTDFKVKEVDVHLGVGSGFTPGSDRLIFKAIIGYAFPVPGKGNDSGSTQSTPLAMGTPFRPPQNAFVVK
jgi:hypothetical protein